MIINHKERPAAAALCGHHTRWRRNKQTPVQENICSQTQTSVYAILTFHLSWPLCAPHAAGAFAIALSHNANWRGASSWCQPGELRQHNPVVSKMDLFIYLFILLLSLLFFFFLYLWHLRKLTIRCWMAQKHTQTHANTHVDVQTNLSGR